MVIHYHHYHFYLAGPRHHVSEVLKVVMGTTTPLPWWVLATTCPNIFKVVAGTTALYTGDSRHHVSKHI